MRRITIQSWPIHLALLDLPSSLRLSLRFRLWLDLFLGTNAAKTTFTAFVNLFWSTQHAAATGDAKHFVDAERITSVLIIADRVDNTQ